MLQVINFAMGHKWVWKYIPGKLIIDMGGAYYYRNMQIPSAELSDITRGFPCVYMQFG